MTKRSKRWWYVAALVAIVTVILLLFRYELVFAWQRMRLSRLPAREKLWAHRVNSYQRFNYLAAYFPGLETDVVFDAGLKKFMVHHPPAPATGLSVETYFKQLKPLQKRLWLDVKGVDTADYNKAVAFFTTCDSLYAIKEQVIIECSQIGFVNILAEHGFITSWEVPIDYLQPETPLQTIDSIKQQLLPAVQYVSQEDIFLPMLKTHFKGRKIITWALSFNNYFDLSHLRSLIADTSVKVILINCKSKGYL